MKNYHIVKAHNQIMVYDSSITKSYSDEAILATIVSHNSDDDLSCHMLAINLATLFRQSSNKSFAPIKLQATWTFNPEV